MIYTCVVIITILQHTHLHASIKCIENSLHQSIIFSLFCLRINCAYSFELKSKVEISIITKVNILLAGSSSLTTT